MAVKSVITKKSVSAKSNAMASEKVSKPTTKKKAAEDEELNASDKAEDVDDDLEEVDDDWGKTEEEDDSWDPDFAEFDLPKTSKKVGKAKKGGGEDAHASDEGDDLDLDLSLEEDDLFDEKDEFDDDF